MEKFIIVFVAIFFTFFLVGHITRKNATVVAGVEMLGRFDDPKYDPSEKIFLRELKRLESIHYKSNGWVLFVSMLTVLLISGVMVPANDVDQVLSACAWLIASCGAMLLIMVIAEAVVTNQLRKKLINRYAIKLANPQY